MIFKDYYKILGLDTNRCSAEQIKAAYREQAKKYHPDVNVGNKKNEERFKDINEAYRVLSTQATRRKYDRMWNRTVGRKSATYEEAKRGKDSLVSDFFTMFFGTVEEGTEKVNKRAAQRGENVDTEVSISIEEAFRGTQKTIGLRTVDGNIKKLGIEVPPGIQNNEKVRLIGHGKPGKNGGKNGDLLVRIKIKDDKNFKLEGYNLRKNLYLTPWEAALSTKLTIHGINEDVQVFIPAGIESGEEISIENKGYKDGLGGRGNLILETRIMIPKELSEAEKKLFMELNEKSDFDPRKNIG